jgi:hypothetical protein
VRGSQQEGGGQAELQAAAIGVQGFVTQHTECDPAACHIVCHIVNHILAWLKISLRKAEAQPQASWRAVLQSGKQLLHHPALVLPTVGDKHIIEEPLALILPTPQTLEPSSEQGLNITDPGVPGFL